jgi:hypothetical protein
LLSSIIVTRKPMVCESPGKGLVVQGKDVSSLVHPTYRIKFRTVGLD